jgi:hypothetical protein
VSVDDHGLEVLKKSGEEVTPGNKSDYYIKVGPTPGIPIEVEIVAGDIEGTEYTEGDIDSTISGKAILFEGASDTLRVPSETNPLPVTEIENDKNKVMEAEDLLETYTWLDFGTKNERIDTIVYTAASVPSVTVTKDFSYVAAGSSYRLTTITWSVT